jgi:hypothetical protein
MRKIIHSYPNFILSTLAIVFLLALIGFYSWAVGAAVTQLRTALVTPVAPPTAGFNLAGAAKLDFRGLITTTSTSSTN